ncbi:MAG: hypothetical protein LBT14_07050 [Treponema sp.]|jgi:hypothetical protein|nr:hypothetical protein [Treponema sp.]
MSEVTQKEGTQMVKGLSFIALGRFYLLFPAPGSLLGLIVIIVNLIGVVMTSRTQSILGSTQ